MDYQMIKSHFNIKQDNGYTCKAVCPCHKDNQASLGITYDDKDCKTLINCLAGCDTRDILKAVGLKMTDLFDREKIITDGSRSSSNIAAVYKYTDENGKVLFEKIRFVPKKFSQRRYVDNEIVWGLEQGTYYETYKGSHNWSKKKRDNVDTKEFEEVIPVIYNLPEVISADTVFIVEGEKDADNLKKIGFTSTTSFDGASKSKQKQKWREEYNKYFNNKSVILIPDNDEQGQVHMEFIAESLKKYQKNQGLEQKNQLNSQKNQPFCIKSIKILSVLDLNLPPKGDISDWLERGHTKEELLKIVNNTPEWNGENARTDIDILQFNFSDVGNAERLIALYGKDMKYSPTRGKWLIWSGKHWRIDTDGQAERLAQKIVKMIQAAGDSIDPQGDSKKEEYKRIIKTFVLKSEGDGRIKAMLNQAKVLYDVPIKSEDTDRDIYLINLKNGTLDLRTGILKNHERRDYITKLVDMDFKAEAKCPNWINFLNKIFHGDNDLIEYIQKSIGYSLSGSITEQCFYMLYGNGANGKSTFLKAIEDILGDYADSLKGSSLMVKRNDDGARGDLAKLQGKRFVVTSELNDGQTFDESLLKALTGGDTVPVRYLYGEDFPLKPQFKLWIGTNEKPKVKGTNLGIWRRVRLIPFLYTFSNEEKDENFYENFLRPELPGILNWAVEGCIKWIKEGIEIPEKVKAAVEDYRGEMDTIEHFINECCLTGDEYTAKITDLYDKYCSWCTENREHELSNIKFSKKLKEKGYEQQRTTYIRLWKGIGLIGEERQQSFREVHDNVYPFGR